MDDEIFDFEFDRETEEVDLEPYEGLPEVDESPTHFNGPQDDLEES